LGGVTTYDVGTHFEWTGSNSVAGAPRRIEERRAGMLSSTGIQSESGPAATGVPCDDVQGRRVGGTALNAKRRAQFNAGAKTK
jgi:hypothetical protein